ncbi:MAG: 50S ribosomal protein L21 [bacterium]|nr:50S ribosomal protein L21 [bacterium]
MDAVPFAVIRTGGKQYVVSPGQKLKVDKLSAAQGGDISFDEVLLRALEGAVEVGRPLVANAAVKAKVLRHGRARKLVVFHYHSKTRHRKKAGHRQEFSEVEITAL